ncbi:MAG TPA: PAS domain S-box protein [Ktedonobacterales bacterium]|nr:PAS domain S-box protein [Ktedonobacterales bacterium]
MARSDSQPSRPSEKPARAHPKAEIAAGPVIQRARRGESALERRFQAIVELAPDAIIVSDADDRIVLVNRQTERLFGYERASLLGQPVALLLPDRFHSESLPGVSYAEAAHMRALESGLQALGRREDGSEFPVEVSLSPLTEDGADAEPLTIATVRDMSELRRTKAAYAALEMASQEQRQLLALTDTALSSLTLDDLLRELMARVQESMSADNVAILLLDESGRELLVRSALGPEEPAVGKARIPVGEGFAGRIVATRVPLVVDDLSAYPVVNPVLHERLRSAVGVPLLANGRLLGVLHADSVAPRHFSEYDVHLLELVGERIALAIDRAQLHAAALAAQAQAERERARWQAAVSSAPAFVVTCDADLRLTYFNPAFERLLDARADMTAPYEDRPAQFGVLLPDGSPIPGDQTPLVRAVHEQRLIRGVELINRNPATGDERLIMWNAAPMRAEDGSTLGGVSVGWDITEQRQLERAARDHTAQLEAIFEAITDGLVVYDTEGRIILSNAAARAQLALFATNTQEETLYERNRQTLIMSETGEPLPEDQWALNRALRGEIISGADPMIAVVRTRTGEDVIFEATAAPLRDAGGHITGAVVVHSDVTARKRLEQEHEEARARELAALELNRRLDEFFAIAAHDIRNPVTTVYTSVQVLQRRLRRLRAALAAGDTEAQSAIIETLESSLGAARSSAERLARLIERLFDIAQARTGKLELQLAPCDLAALAREQVAAQCATQPRRVIQLELPGDQPVMALADADRLGEVLANYLSNALKYSARERPVVARLEVTGGRARVAVRDEGPGLPPKQQAMVWEMFQNAPGVEPLSAVEGQGSRLGLGLHICKRLVEAHPGGAVGLESEVGVGSTFWFELPLLSDTPSIDEPDAR